MRPPIDRCKWIALFVTLIVQAASSQATTFVAYEADVDPTVNSQAFSFSPSNGSNPPLRTVSGGLLTLGNSNLSGSHNFSRGDSAGLNELFIAEFRVRSTEAGGFDETRIRAAVTNFGFGSSSENVASILVFVGDGVVRLRQAGLSTAPFIDNDIQVDTSVFHTYAVVKETDASVSLYIDGELAISQEAVVSRPPNGAFPYQSLSANPLSQADWDFFRYAIGPDANDFIPIPEPGSLLGFSAAGALLLVQRRRKH